MLQEWQQFEGRSSTNTNQAAVCPESGQDWNAAKWDKTKLILNSFPWRRRWFSKAFEGWFWYFISLRIALFFDFSLWHELSEERCKALPPCCSSFLVIFSSLAAWSPSRGGRNPIHQFYLRIKKDENQTLKAPSNAHSVHSIIIHLNHRYSWFNSSLLYNIVKSFHVFIECVHASI